MLNKLPYSELFIKGGLYSIISIFQFLIGFILLPIITIYLTPEDYGIVGLMAITAAFFLVFTKTPVAHGFVRYYYFDDLKTDRKILLFNCTLFALTQSLFWGIIISLFSSFFSSKLFNTSEYYYLFFYYAILISIQPIEEISIDLIKIQKNAKLIFKIQILNIILSNALIVILLTIFKLGLLSLVIGSLFVSICNLSMTLPTLLKNISLKINIRTLKPLLVYGIPLIPAILSQFLLRNIDLYIINSYLEIKQVGIYVFSLKFAMIIILFFSIPIRNIFDPIIYEKESKERNHIEYLEKSTIFFYSLSIVFWSIISLFSKDVIELLARNPEFWEAYHYIPILALGYAHFGLLDFLGKGIEDRKSVV